MSRFPSKSLPTQPHPPAIDHGGGLDQCNPPHYSWGHSCTISLCLRFTASSCLDLWATAPRLHSLLPSSPQPSLSPAGGGFKSPGKKMHPMQGLGSSTVFIGHPGGSGEALAGVDGRRDSSGRQGSLAGKKSRAVHTDSVERLAGTQWLTMSHSHMIPSASPGEQRGCHCQAVSVELCGQDSGGAAHPQLPWLPPAWAFSSLAGIVRHTAAWEATEAASSGS